MAMFWVVQLAVLIHISATLYVTPLPEADHVPSHQIPHKSHTPRDIVKTLPMFYGVPKFKQFIYENSKEEVYSRKERNEIFPYLGSASPAPAGEPQYRHVYSTPSSPYSPAPSVTPAPADYPNYSHMYSTPSPAYSPAHPVTPAPGEPHYSHMYSTPSPPYTPHYEVSSARSYYEHPTTPTTPAPFQYSPSYYGPHHHITASPVRREENPHLQQNLVYTDTFFQSHSTPGYHTDYSKYVITNNYDGNYLASLGKTDQVHLPLMTNSVEDSAYQNYKQRQSKLDRQQKEYSEARQPFKVTPKPMHTVPLKPAISFIDPPARPLVSQPVTQDVPHQPVAQPLTPRPLILSPQSLHSQSVTLRPRLKPKTQNTFHKTKPLVLAPKLPTRQKLTFQDTRQVDPHQRQQQQQQSARTSVIARQPKSLKTSRRPAENSLISDRVKEGSRSAALLKLMEIAGEDWSRSREEDRAPSRAKTVKFSCPESEGNFPAPDSCSVYYQCAQGTPHRRQCDTGLYWSVDTDMCDWRDNVQCLTPAR